MIPGGLVFSRAHPPVQRLAGPVVASRGPGGGVDELQVPPARPGGLSCLSSPAVGVERDRQRARRRRSCRCRRRRSTEVSAAGSAGPPIAGPRTRGAERHAGSSSGRTTVAGRAGRGRAGAAAPAGRCRGSRCRRRIATGGQPAASRQRARRPPARSGPVPQGQLTGQRLMPSARPGRPSGPSQVTIACHRPSYRQRGVDPGRDRAVARWRRIDAPAGAVGSRTPSGASPGITARRPRWAPARSSAAARHRPAAGHGR